MDFNIYEQLYQWGKVGFWICFLCTIVLFFKWNMIDIIKDAYVTIIKREKILKGMVKSKGKRKKYKKEGKENIQHDIQQYTKPLSESDYEIEQESIYIDDSNYEELIIKEEEL